MQQTQQATYITQNATHSISQNKVQNNIGIKVTVNILDSAKNPMFKRVRINRIYNILKPREFAYDNDKALIEL